MHFSKKYTIEREISRYLDENEQKTINKIILIK